MDFAAQTSQLAGKLHALSARTDAAEKRILQTAQEREEAVLARMQELRPTAITNAASSGEYQTLAIERRRLSLVIAMARTHIGA